MAKKKQAEQTEVKDQVEKTEAEAQPEPAPKPEKSHRKFDKFKGENK